MKKKIFTLLLVLLGVLQSYAQTKITLTFKSVKYTLNTIDHTAAASGYDTKSGISAISIPATVTDGGTTYNVTSIIDQAFWGVDILSLNLLKATNLKTIGAKAFYSSSLSGAIIIPANVTSIGEEAFYTTDITSLDLSGATNLQTIGASAFYSCASLSGSITIPANVTSIGKQAFYTTAITSLGFSTDSHLQTIGDYAFTGCTNLTGSLTIPEGVKSIGNDTFHNCTHIQSVSLPTTLQTIGANAFYSCSAVTGGITIHASVTSIGDGAFANCGISSFINASNQKYKVQGEALLTSDGTKILAFPKASNTTIFTIPATVTEIGPYAFYNCSKLISITAAADRIITIGYQAFDGCGWYNSAIKPNNQNQIFYFGKVAYSYIGTVPAGHIETIKDGTISITANLFYNAASKANLVSVKIPSSVTTINEKAFQQLSGLKTVDLSSATGLKTIGKSAFGQTALESITIPSGVTTIGDHAFYYCTALTTADLSQTAQLATVGDNAFSSCSKLAEVLLPNLDKTPTWGYNVFSGNSGAQKFYVKDGTGTYALANYTGAANLSGFANASNTFRYLPKTVTAAKIGTLYLPYEVAIPSGVNAFYCSSSTSSSLGFTQLTGGVIPANTPVIVTADNAADFNFLGNGGRTAKPNGMNDALNGAASNITNDTNTYPYLTLGQKTNSAPAEYGFYTYTGTMIAANTCYILASSLSHNAKGFTLSFDGGTTAIEATTATAEPAMKVYYDLQGRRVLNPTKGIYIVNGKKVVIKQ